MIKLYVTVVLICLRDVSVPAQLMTSVGSHYTI